MNPHDSSPSFNNDQFPAILAPSLLPNIFVWIFESNSQVSYLLIYKYSSVYH